MHFREGKVNGRGKNEICIKRYAFIDRFNGKDNFSWINEENFSDRMKFLIIKIEIVVKSSKNRHKIRIEEY